MLQVEDLRKTFDEGLFKPRKEILKGVSFGVRRGEIYGFLGPNGAGKTTVIKAITELIFPDSGKISIGGLPHDSLEAKRRIGFMPENPYFYNHLTGPEFLHFYADLLGIDGAAAGNRVQELIALVGLKGRAGGKMRTFSKGMLQRIGLAQALLGEPELLILDEPLSGLDPIGRRDVRDIIMDQKERGTTVFFSSHIIPDVETLCDRVAILIDGTVRAVGEIEQIVSHEVEFYEITFIGGGPGDLKTPVAASYEGSNSSWVRVQTSRRDELIDELGAAGHRLISVVPQRRALEDFLMSHYEEEGR